ncbi:hypothetical protein [Amycolatopsis sp. WAC 01375]|uniref:hypothetical protein n=1 Tax=Amycolatopsis sp. WAC 01375 TaxID=2203194 RepID=UPI001F2664E2|nr:hypothetical protein [Amycolatopsis sp. WAC 01375]
MDGRSRGRTPAATASRRLAGNVGYLKTKSFYGPDIAGRRDDALATTDSLIVDVRENRSGDPMAVALLISPRRQYKVDTQLDVTVPGGRAVNPVTGTNWEGVGVRPDIAVDVEAAFDAAYALALAHVLTLGDSGVRRQIADEARLTLAGLG